MRLQDIGREVKVEINDGKYMVDADAYVPTRIRVEQYLAAGRQLDEYNRSLSYDDYENEQEAEEACMDVTRAVGFDPADITAGEGERSEILNAVKKAVSKSKGSVAAGTAADGNSELGNHAANDT